jgi:hypothetical protein
MRPFEAHDHGARRQLSLESSYHTRHYFPHHPGEYHLAPAAGPSRKDKKSASGGVEMKWSEGCQEG